MILTSYFEPIEWPRIWAAAREGRLSKASVLHLNREAGEIGFETNDPYGLCSQLEAVVDFGATTAIDVFGLAPRWAQ